MEEAEVLDANRRVKEEKEKSGVCRAVNSPLSFDAKPAAHFSSWHDAENMLMSIFQLLFSSIAPMIGLPTHETAPADFFTAL